LAPQTAGFGGTSFFCHWATGHTTVVAQLQFLRAGEVDLEFDVHWDFVLGTLQHRQHATHVFGAGSWLVFFVFHPQRDATHRKEPRLQKEFFSAQAIL
jgi:hypothetical protein